MSRSATSSADFLDEIADHPRRPPIFRQRAQTAATYAFRPRLAVNDVDWAHEAARRGIGIALLPEYACRDDLRAGRLRRVLTAWSSGERTIYALSPTPRHLSRKLVAFVEMLSTGFQDPHALS